MRFPEFLQQEQRLNPDAYPGMLTTVSMTLEQIIEETRHCPPEKVGELVDYLTRALSEGAPETEAAWKSEINQRLEKIPTGKGQGATDEELAIEAWHLL
jgi:hypothetical protein